MRRLCHCQLEAGPSTPSRKGTEPALRMTPFTLVLKTTLPQCDDPHRKLRFVLLQSWHDLRAWSGCNSSFACTNIRWWTFDARAKGEQSRCPSARASPTRRCTPISSKCIPAIWTTRNSSGLSSATSSTACTITWWRCLSARRSIAKSMQREREGSCDLRRWRVTAVLGLRAAHCWTRSARDGPIRFRATWSFAFTSPSWAITRRPRSSSAKRETSTPPAMFTRCLGACWRGSSKRCGVRWIRRRASTLIELGPGRGLFARDVLDWSAKQFPGFASRALWAGGAIGGFAREDCGTIWPSTLRKEVRADKPTSSIRWKGRGFAGG